MYEPVLLRLSTLTRLMSAFAARADHPELRSSDDACDQVLIGELIALDVIADHMTSGLEATLPADFVTAQDEVHSAIMTLRSKQPNA